MSEIHDSPPEPTPDDELFIEFANTVELTDGRPEEALVDGEALGAWLVERGLPTDSATRLEAALPAFRDLRSLVHDVTARVAEGRQPSVTQLRRLNRVLRDGLHYHQLRPTADGASFTVGQVGDALAQARAAIAGSLAHYLADHDLRRIRVCANDGCRWRFIDRSPAARRRWCDMRTCGNRAKVARHRARARSASAERTTAS